MEHRIVSQDEWVAARKQLLVKEKEFTRLRDSARRASGARCLGSRSRSRMSSTGRMGRKPSPTSLADTAS